VDTPRLCVVHSSDRIRETVAILLEGHGRVAAFSADAVSREPSLCADADLLIIEAEAATQVLPSLPRGRPVLWLLGSAHHLPPSLQAESAFVPPSFQPRELIARVDALLAPARSGQRQAELSFAFPFIAETAATLGRIAQGTDLPVLLCGEVGVGKSRLARAIAAATPRRSIHVLSTRSGARHFLQEIAATGTNECTLFVRNVLELDSDDVGTVCDLVDHGGFASASGWLNVRLIGSAPVLYQELSTHPGMPPGLFYRLGALTIELPPLRERSADMPALAQAVADGVTTTLRRSTVTFSPAALQRLQHYLWFGNLAELETVLARSIALLDTDAALPVLDTPDLQFGYRRPTPVTRHPATLAQAVVEQPLAVGSAASHTAALIIQELAHELKNPLVAIKTVTQQLDQLTRDDVGRQEATKLAGDAVERLDQTIDNLLQFSHFGRPLGADVALNSLLATALSSAKRLASERGIRFDYTPPAPQLVHVDPNQINYALENLLRAVIRDVNEGCTITIASAANNGAVRIEFQKGGMQISERLSAMIGPATNGHSAAEPLGFVFAKALVERNAGRMDVVSSGSGRVVTIQLPHERNSPPR